MAPQPFTHQAHLCALPQHTRQVIDSLVHQLHSVCLKLLHAKLPEIGLEADAGPVVRWLQGGRSNTGFEAAGVVDVA